MASGGWGGWGKTEKETDAEKEGEGEARQVALPHKHVPTRPSLSHHAGPTVA